MRLSSIIKSLIAAGGTMEQVLAVVSAAEDEQEQHRAAKRAGEAERQRRHRLSRSVTRDSTEPASTQSFSKKVIKNPPSPPTGALPPTGASRHRGSALPSDWQPKPRHVAKATELGRDERWLNDLADRMREWAGANSNRAIARKANWDLTFDGFIRNELSENRTRAGPLAINNSRFAGRPEPRNPWFAALEAELKEG